MDISKVDENFASAKAEYKGLNFVDAKAAPFKLYGVTFDKVQGLYTRMPREIAEKVSDGVNYLYKNTSGGRLRFRTDSSKIAIAAEICDGAMMGHMTAVGAAGFSLYINNVFHRAFVPQVCSNFSYDGQMELPDGMLDITIYFPLYGNVKSLSVGLEKSAKIEPPLPYKNEKPIVFYGSSITQGGCASRPGNSYDAILCRYLDSDYINLGFSGNAKGERLMAEHIAGIDASLFVLDYDHNAPTIEHLENTHRNFYELYRQTRPDVPIILMTKPDFDSCPPVNAKRRDVIRRTYEHGKAKGDNNLYFIDGETLFGDDGRDCCTVDGCHPNDLGFFRMAQTVYRVVQKIPQKAQ